MFNNEKRTKIKNTNIQEWRLDLTVFRYTINIALTRRTWFLIHIVELTLVRPLRLQPSPTVTMDYATRVLLDSYILLAQKNLPFSMEEVKKKYVLHTVCVEI